MKLKNILHYTFETFFPYRKNRGFTHFIVNHFKNNNHNNIIGCEIGVDCGYNAFSILYMLQKNGINMEQFYLIDSYNDWMEIENNAEIIIKHSLKNNKDIARNILKKYINQCIFFYEKSDIVVKHLKEIISGFDFVYIDGCHNFVAVERDITNYYPLVKKGGIMGGHDFSSRCGVPKAVLSFVEKENLELFGNLDTACWWVIK
jgi:hypothetical protein